VIPSLYIFLALEIVQQVEISSFVNSAGFSKMRSFLFGPLKASDEYKIKQTAFIDSLQGMAKFESRKSID